jgi:hypothetical protein
VVGGARVENPLRAVPFLLTAEVDEQLLLVEVDLAGETAAAGDKTVGSGTLTCATATKSVCSSSSTWAVWAAWATASLLFFLHSQDQWPVFL